MPAGEPRAWHCRPTAGDAPAQPCGPALPLGRDSRLRASVGFPRASRATGAPAALVRPGQTPRGRVGVRQPEAGVGKFSLFCSGTKDRSFAGPGAA